MKGTETEATLHGKNEIHGVKKKRNKARINIILTVERFVGCGEGARNLGEGERLNKVFNVMLFLWRPVVNTLSGVWLFLR